MKILILFGSPRRSGITKQLLDMFLKDIDAHIEIIYSNEVDVSECVDCRYCWKNPGCVIDDDMNDIYSKFETADAFIIASPIYFSSISGSLKIIIDRLQTFWSSVHVRKDNINPNSFYKKGVGLFVGGAKQYGNQFASAEEITKEALFLLNANYIGNVTFSNSDRELLQHNTDIINEINSLRQKFYRIEREIYE